VPSFARRVTRFRAVALCCTAFAFCAAAQADGTLHSLWEIHGKRNVVYILGSIHVLRPSDYPLAPVVLDAYRNAKSLYMEVDPQELESDALQAELLSSATMPEDHGLPDVLGRQRYEHATALAHDMGVELATFDRFAPWFAAEAISQLQLVQLGFQPQSGVEMVIADKARSDGKPVAGLETVRDQIDVFRSMPLEAQADYLLSTLEEARDLPREVDAMVKAWQHGDTAWFAAELKGELKRGLYESFLVARNRKWVPKIETLLNEDRNYLVIVGTGHLVGVDSVLELLKKDGIAATQR
jgi:uncharacterized protein YbaP (TraB family)